MSGLIHIGRRPLPREVEGLSSEADWKQASPARIQKALAHALTKSAGGWFVLDASSRVGHTLQRFEVAGRELVAWRSGGELRVAPAACPHMGADLSCGTVRDGKVICPWHGLELGEERHGAWATLRTYEDGLLSWVQIPGIEALTDTPVYPSRPAEYLAGVIRMDVRCESQDVIANRLDPWHGVHFHPHSFARLRVLEESPDSILLRVSYRIAGRVAMEVDATFDCPSSRVIVMTIVRGEGEGSLVETHATPLGEGRCAVIEATIATSDRGGFLAMTKSALIRRVMAYFIERRAARLWVEDAMYAERTYALRQEEFVQIERRPAALRSRAP
ncbi:MAG: DUF5914 domain-containing protein [Nannocystaceae bacterium]